MFSFLTNLHFLGRHKSQTNKKRESQCQVKEVFFWNKPNRKIKFRQICKKLIFLQESLMIFDTHKSVQKKTSKLIKVTLMIRLTMLLLLLTMLPCWRCWFSYCCNRCWRWCCCCCCYVVDVVVDVDVVVVVDVDAVGVVFFCLRCS